MWMSSSLEFRGVPQLKSTISLHKSLGMEHSGFWMEAAQQLGSPEPRHTNRTAQPVMSRGYPKLSPRFGDKSSWNQGFRHVYFEFRRRSYGKLVKLLCWWALVTKGAYYLLPTPIGKKSPNSWIKEYTWDKNKHTFLYKSLPFLKIWIESNSAKAKCNEIGAFYW